MSKKRTEANRRNARHSTGPRSPEGRARSALNALKHGLTAERAILPGESAEAYGTLRREIFDELQPDGALESALVDQLVAALQRLSRVPVVEAGLIARTILQAEAARARGRAKKSLRDEFAHLRAKVEQQTSEILDREAYDAAQEEQHRVKAEMKSPTVGTALAFVENEAAFATLARHSTAIQNLIFKLMDQLDINQKPRRHRPHSDVDDRPDGGES